MILEEMEILKEREKELKKSHQWAHNEDGDQQHHPGYDSNDEYEAENDFIGGEEEEQASTSGKSKVSVLDKIQDEIIELEARELELQKKRTQRPVYHPQQPQQQKPQSKKQQKRKQQHNSVNNLSSDIEGDNNDDEIGQPGALSKKPIFGSRDDLVKFFGEAEEIEVEEEEEDNNDDSDDETEEATKTRKPPQQQQKKTKKNKDLPNTVRIPKVFKRMEKEAAIQKQQQQQQLHQQKKQQQQAKQQKPNNTNKPKQPINHENQRQQQQRRPKSSKSLTTTSTTAMRQSNGGEQQALEGRGRSQSFTKTQITQETFRSHDRPDQAQNKKV